MALVGKCGLCGMARKDCGCLSRPRDNDPFLDVFEDVLTYLNEPRIFGGIDPLQGIPRKDVVLSMVSATRKRVYDAVANGTLPDSNILKRVDRDAERVERRLKGRLYATHLMVSDKELEDKRIMRLPSSLRPTGFTRRAERASPKAIITNAEIIRRLKHKP